MAAALGREFAKFDYLVQLFRVREFVEAKYDQELSADVRALCEAYADGVNHYAALHPEKMPHIVLPVTGKDVVAGATFKAPFFYELHAHLQALLDDGGVLIGEKGEMGRRAARTTPYTRLGESFGSNAFAVGPSRSADGTTRLAINSHQPWTGPVAWYETHVHSEEGWNMAGGTFPGGPVIFVGHDEDKGWCHTINRPDLVDIFELQVNPDNKNQYWFDGAWRNFDRERARLRVKVLGPLRLTIRREMLWSVQGPVFRTKRGVFALRFVGYGEVGHIEQWYRMNKARNLDEFLAAMNTMRLTSLNTMYADKDGNLFYAYNGKFPLREEGHDWRAYLPGDKPELVWTQFRSFRDVPQILNPPSGMLQSCNNSPFHTTVGEGNPAPEAFSQTMGIETYMTNRAWRALELYGGDPSITRDEFYRYKYDKTYSDLSDMARFLENVRAKDAPADALTAKARDLVLSWDRVTEKDSAAAALAVLAWRMHRRARAASPADPTVSLR
ncbi:MAG TPA: penicillin acylase family protein, partial [Candidatus Hydrogenedentes bacterium]|nr:penicillin acylase family protein [Candidatus Hydrogenedentota bacterium]